VLRSEVLQPFIDLSAKRRYLEIGVEAGTTFHTLRAAKKVAVDPIFRFNVPEPRLTSSVEYQEVTSDEYFGALSRDEKFDVIYVDGLHTVEQTLRDLLNAVEHLDSDGVIVVDDVIPSSWGASLDLQSDAAFVRDKLATEKFDGENWMGPVFRVVYFVASVMQSFDYATIQDNHGQLVMWRGPRREVYRPDMTLDQIARVDFLDILKDMSVFRVMPHAEIMKLYRQAIAGSPSEQRQPSFA
jgi:hypothetical protein